VSFEITLALAGAAASILAGLLTNALKDISEKREKLNKEKYLEDAKRRVTEVGFSLAGIHISHRINHDPLPQTQVTDQLLREIENEIATLASERLKGSREEIRSEVESRLNEIKGRIQAIEERFPDKSSIDKIASINDALFAERIEQLGARLEKLEAKQLTKWDVAITVSMVVAGIFAVVGATYAVLIALGVISGGA